MKLNLFGNSCLVIVRLSGGLGNQMFQYSRALIEADRLKGCIIIEDYILRDYIYTSRYTKRFFELSCFKRNYQFLVPDFIPFLPMRGIFYRIIGEILKIFYTIRSKFFNIGKVTYLKGDFHDNDELLEYHDLISKHFVLDIKTIQMNWSSELNLLKNRIELSNSVSIHVRRGDYLIGKNSLLHHVCGLDYYHIAVRKLQSMIGDAQLFVFSDDIEWCRHNLNFGVKVHFVETNCHITDFYLMTICKHNIIANSTFSWWAAFLNKSPSKIVFYPIKWVAMSEYRIVSPSTWFGI